MSSISPELEVIGRDIAHKCRVVPLVATVIGGTMCNKRDKDGWVSLGDSSLWDSLGNREGIVHVLRLSFYRLSSSALKQCFLYCSFFPKGLTIGKELLILFWMAEGFLQQPKGSTIAFEDIGNEHFYDLLSNSLLQDVEKDLYGCITSCNMHDLVHDLAQSIRNSETNTPHIQPSNFSDVMKLWHSLFFNSSFFHLKGDFKGLRVLKFCDPRITSLPDSIGSLKHLRYFDISRTCIRRLPESITQLYNLQTLILLRCCVRDLPKGLKYLVNFRHLYIDFGHFLHQIHGLTNLTNLQTLPLFVVSKNCNEIGVLGYLSELGGKLKLYHLEDVRNKREAEEAKVMEKKKLQKLTYNWSGILWFEESNNEEVLEGLKPHSNLKSFAVKYYCGRQFPSWLTRKTSISGSSACFHLINLVKLKLVRCQNLEKLPTLGQYPNLKILKLIDLCNVRCMGNEFCVDANWYDDTGDFQAIPLFPELETFTLHKLERLEKWLIQLEPSIAVFPSLKQLRINNCYKLSRVPMMSKFSSLEILKIYECSMLSWEDGLFPSTLRILPIGECKKLRSIPSVEGGISFLQELTVEYCDELYEIDENLLVSTSLRVVRISYCPKLISICIPPMSKKLETLYITDCPELTSIPSLDGFSSLLELMLRHCEKLTSPLSGLETCASLQHLWLYRCPNVNLKSIPGESLKCLTRLKKLELGPFSEEQISSVDNLHFSLEDLTLDGQGKKRSLPVQLQHFIALQRLHILNFHKLEKLPDWLGNLPSLRELEIQYCKGLRYLPSKEAIQRLSKLRRIYINSCPLLKGNSLELSKIFHIPSIKIE